LVNNVTNTPQADLQRILESARRLGVEMDQADALQWMTAMAAAKGAGDVVVDVHSGTFGTQAVMLDFSPEQLAHFRAVGKIVEFFDQPGVVETALALSGSAAQSKIQTYPGDCDYFERVNIKADTRAQACTILARLIREKVASATKGPTFQLIEVKFGSYPFDVVKDGKPQKSKTPISWTPGEVNAGQFDCFHPDGSPATIRWDEVAGEPGWCKLDWVVADPQRGQLANASNMLDVTWEAPDGSITPLDGYLDPYFQEVYLDADSIPVFSKLAKHVSSDALDNYVAQLENEIRKYLAKDHLNYGKAAKRMYNVFRLTGRYPEAAFLRELFDEPATLLYQVWSLIRTIDDCSQPDSSISIESLLDQTDHLILDVVKTLEGAQENEIVKRLLRLRQALERQERGNELNVQAEAARAEVIDIVNNFFYDKLTALPTIKDYIAKMEE
jgi:hypothetical protein